VPKSPASYVSSAAFGVAMRVNFVPAAVAVLARAKFGAFIERWRGRAGQ
jgi:hypothetical protein